MWETGNNNREPVSCDNSAKEENMPHDCRNERQDSGVLEKSGHPGIE